MLNNGVITWTSSKHHDVAALSTTYAKYVALTWETHSAVHYGHLMHDIRQR
jgi:hypothetical protein